MGDSRIARDQPAVVFLSGMVWSLVLICLCSSVGLAASGANTPSALTAHSGLLYMPTARITDGEAAAGISFSDPYGVAWGRVGVFEGLELSARHTYFRDTRSPTPGQAGHHEDNAFDAKILLLRESGRIPAVALGWQDFSGSRDFEAPYAALSKEYGALEILAGFGGKRLDGWFGGIAWRPTGLSGLSLALEYDATDYENDLLAAQSGAADRDAGLRVGVTTRRGPFTGTLAFAEDQVDIGFSAALDLTTPPRRRDLGDSRNGGIPHGLYPRCAEPAQAKAEALARLHETGITVIEIVRSDDALTASFQAPSADDGRILGRVARGLLCMEGEPEMLSITRTDTLQHSMVTFEIDRRSLERYLDGEASYAQLLHHISRTAPDTAHQSAASLLSNSAAAGVQRHGWSIEWHHGTSQIAFNPLGISDLYGDEADQLSFDLHASVLARQRLPGSWLMSGALQYRYLETFDAPPLGNNSELPHVRSDIERYRSGNRLTVDHAVVTGRFDLTPQIVIQPTIGLYEEMFGGIGLQSVWVAKDRPAFLDLTIDALRQRDTDGDFGLRDYDTVSALVGGGYRFSQLGIDARLQAGRFLAEDLGVRLEVAREFRSGVRLGAWYTRTDANDRTGPGSSSSPYFDRGISIEIPFSLLGSASGRNTRVRWRPFARDGGQVVDRPLDLVNSIDRKLPLQTFDSNEYLSRIGE